MECLLWVKSRHFAMHTLCLLGVITGHLHRNKMKDRLAAVSAKFDHMFWIRAPTHKSNPLPGEPLATRLAQFKLQTQ